MRRAIAVTLTTVAVLVAARAAAADAAYTPAQREMLAIRAAHVAGLDRLTRRVLDARLGPEETVAQALGAGGPKEIALRVFLRSARMVGAPRLYSDGVAEVDVEAPLDAVVAKVVDLVGQRPERVGLEDLKRRAIDGLLSTSGRGRAPPGVSAEVLERLEAAPVEALVDMYPAGWERVTATGRVLAVRAARVAAYEAMVDRLKGILLGKTETVGDLVQGTSAAEAALEAYVRSRPVAGPPRLMPDGIAEVEVAAGVRRFIEVLKDIRRLRGQGSRWTDEQIDRLSVRVKSARITVVGRGMPPPEAIRPAPTVAAGEALPDWAADVLEARGTARLSPAVPDGKRARLLAARSAKGRALATLRRKVDRLGLGNGTTVRARAARDATFRRDVETFLDSARTAVYRPVEDGRAWEVVLRLPLLRLYQFSRRGG